MELELTGWRRKLVRLGALSGVDQGASRAISDCHVSVQLNHFIYYLIVAVCLKWQSDITPGASTHGEVAFTMAAKAEGMYVVIDQVLTMRKEGEMSGDLLGLSIAGGGATAATKEVALAFAGLTNSTLVGPQSAGSGDDDGSGIPEGEEQMAQWL